jgi:hypothetical protein
MRVLITSLIILSVLVNSFSQVTNPSFELWNNINGIDQPEGWITNNKNGFVSVKKVPKLTNGDYAMNVKSNGISIEGRAPGSAKCSFIAAPQVNQILMNYRIDSINSPGEILITVKQKNGNQDVQLTQWSSKYTTQGIETLLLSFNQVSIDSMSIEILANSKLSSLGYVGYAEIIIDDISLNSSVAVDDLIKDDEELEVILNGQLVVQFPLACHITLLAVNGAVINSYHYNNPFEKLVYPVNHLSQGIYLMNVKFSNGEIQNYKVHKVQ